jgi:predicted ATP-grasp superfamily ATP-dependent carboligase
LAERWGLCGLFGVDTVLADEEVWTIEVNPRYPASVEVWERATGASAVACHHAACDGAMPDLHALPVARRVVGKAIVNSPRDVTIDTELDRRLMRLTPNGPGPTLADLPLADLPRIGQAIPAGAPVLTVFAEGAEYAATYRLLRTRVSQLRATLRRH